MLYKKIGPSVALFQGLVLLVAAGELLLFFTSNIDWAPAETGTVSTNRIARFPAKIR